MGKKCMGWPVGSKCENPSNGPKRKNPNWCDDCDQKRCNDLSIKMNNLLPKKKCEICDKDIIENEIEYEVGLCSMCGEIKQGFDTALVEHGAIILIKCLAKSFQSCEGASELYRIGEILEKEVKTLE